MITTKLKYFLLVVSFLAAISLKSVWAQKTNISAELKTDSLQNKLDTTSLLKSGIDSLRSNLVDAASDSSNVNQPDTTIAYSSENIRYLATDSTQILILETKALLKYKNITLSADTIYLDLRTKIVRAAYSMDTLKADGLTRSQDSVVYIGIPSMKEGDEIVTGSAITYNLDTREGRVAKSKTVMRNANPVDNTYFQSEQLLKLDDNTLNGLQAKITSCDKDEPDYYFLVDSVIVTKNDWVFAKPVKLHFGDVPVAYFPFALYKKNSGRHSGLIIPTYDYSSARGNGLKHLGFFWDISPYLDYTVTGDFYDLHSEFILDQNLRYNQKYIFDGNIAHRAFRDQEIKGWGLSGRHWQEFTPTTHLNADYNYVSNTSMVRKTGETAIDRMQNKLTSNGTFRKEWLQNGDYLILNSSLTQFVDTAITQFTAPSISFSLAGRKPFQKYTNWVTIAKDLNAGGSFSLNRYVDNQEARHFYTDLTTFNVNFAENTKYDNFTLSSGQVFTGRYLETRAQNTLINTTDQYSLIRKDSSDYNKSITTSSALAYNHTLFNRFIKMEERLSYNHDLAFNYTNYNGDLVKGLADRQTYSFSTSLNTWIYGIFSPRIGSLQKIRHTISPALSFSYAPDFSKEEYGYFHYKTITDANGSLVVNKIDKFSGSGLGATPTSETSLLNYSLGNSVEAKLQNGEKETETENRQLFTLNFSGNVNLLTDKFSDIAANFNSTIYNGELVGKYVGLRINSDAAASISSTNWDFKNYNYGYTVTFPLVFDGRVNQDFFKQFVITDSTDLKQQQLILKEKKENSFTDMGLKITSNVNFSEKRSYTLKPLSDSYSRTYDKVFVADLNISLNPTLNWAIVYGSQLNFTQPKVVTLTTISIVRDMHCWEGSFNWDLYNQGFKLLISTKSSIFQDLKFDKDTQKSRRYY